MDEELIGSVKEAVAGNFTEQRDFLSELVATKSVNEAPEETADIDVEVELAISQIISQRLKRWKLTPSVVELRKKRPNVVCRFGPARARKSLILHAHMDTNPMDQSYQGDPLQAFVRGDRMYGWGVWNMKASISAYMYAVKALTDLRVRVGGRLWLLFAADGVAGLGSKLGIKYLLNKGYKAKAAILGSPGPSVGIGHRGGYRFKITTKGEAVHTGGLAWQRKEKGKNAIEMMAQVIEALKGTEVPFKAAKAFPGKKPVFTFPTTISGGTAVNIVPAECTAFGDVRLMPGNSHRQVRMRIEEKLDELEAIDYEVEDVLYVPAVEVDGKEEVVESMVEAYEQGIGEKPRVEGIGPWNNGWVFIQKDIPAIIQVPLRGGISRWGVEWVSMPSLKKLTVAVALTIVNYLGMKKKL